MTNQRCQLWGGPKGRCAGGDFTCSAMNTCRTCSTFSDMGGFCSALDTFPNASIAEYGVIAGEHAIMVGRGAQHNR